MCYSYFTSYAFSPPEFLFLLVWCLTKLRVTANKTLLADERSSQLKNF